MCLQMYRRENLSCFLLKVSLGRRKKRRKKKEKKEENNRPTEKMTPTQVLAQFSPVIISPLNKYVFDKSYNTENMTLIATSEKFETPLFLKTVFLHP